MDPPPRRSPPTPIRSQNLRRPRGRSQTQPPENSPASTSPPLTLRSPLLNLPAEESVSPPSNPTITAPLSTLETDPSSREDLVSQQQQPPLLQEESSTDTGAAQPSLPPPPPPFYHFDMPRHTVPARSEPTRSPQYQLVSPGTTSDPRSMSQNNKDQLIQSLRTHKVNTITELRRIEKIFAYLDSSEVTEPMTAAWAHYVNSNNLLNELRGLTKNYPFSSECLDEAKALVVRDPASVRSWNYCWLVLLKMEREHLIAKYARALASKPSMWGGRAPTSEGVDRLANACIAEWTRALRQMLRHWDKPPSTTGH